MEKKELNLNELPFASGGAGEDARYFIHTVKKGEDRHALRRECE